MAFLIQNIVITVTIGVYIVIFSGVVVEICTAFDGLKPIAQLIPNYYITRLNEGLHNPLFLAMGLTVSLAVIALAGIIILGGCAGLKTENLIVTLGLDNFDDDTRTSIRSMSEAERDAVLKSVFEKSNDTLIEVDYVPFAPFTHIVSRKIETI